MDVLVGGIGLEPIEAEANRFTVCTAANYGITTQMEIGLK